MGVKSESCIERSSRSIAVRGKGGGSSGEPLLASDEPALVPSSNVILDLISTDAGYNMSQGQG